MSPRWDAMYLAEIDLRKRAFRLWICPHAIGNRTNEEGLIGLASQGIQDVSGKKQFGALNSRVAHIYTSGMFPATS